MYSKNYMKHFASPLNIGLIENYTYMTEVVNKEDGCFDKIRLYLLVENQIIKDAKYQLKACSGTIVSFSVLTELLKNKDIGFLNELTEADLIAEMGELPPKKGHSVRLALEAVANIIEQLNK